MALSDITRHAVLAAVDEYDRIGRPAYLAKYGFGPARQYLLILGDRSYDSKAIVGAAHGYLGGSFKALKAGDFSGGEATVATLLRELGFEVAAGQDASDIRRNPPWTRDELILALDLYMTDPESPPGKTSKAVRELSDLLSRLGQQIGRSAKETYRNANGVYMKMMNFRRFDPEVIASGKVGLQRGGKDEEAVWHEFAGDPKRLSAVAAAIRAAVERSQPEQLAPYDEDVHPDPLRTGQGDRFVAARSADVSCHSCRGAFLSSWLYQLVCRCRKGGGASCEEHATRAPKGSCTTIGRGGMLPSRNHGRYGP